MRKNYFFIGIIISLGFSILVLYTRKENWLSIKNKVMFLMTMSITGIVGFISSNDNEA